MKWRQTSILIAGLSMLIAALVWSQMGIYLTHLFFGVDVPVNFFQFCISLFKEDSLYYFLIIFLLNTIIAYTILITAIKIVEQYVLLRRFRKKILSLRNEDYTSILNLDFNRPNQDILVINHDQPLAFSMGFRIPIIVLSTGLIDMLDGQELEAVVYHETFHQQNYDSLKTFALQLISQAMWYIPLTKWSYENYKIISELSADEYAVHKMGSELGLGSALIKLIKQGFQVNSAPVIVHFSDVSVNYRLQQLLEPKKTIPVKPDAPSVVISIYVLFLLMSMIVVVLA
ncbi:M56 family metallopeptidase [Ammoniphilus sp. 3BR4]|uniref:M56 family metallopeptidase n=1 Tax=Ammoniphilus sp. 3BR4 TaxID=3158265 RepID=UPI003466C9CD